MMSEDEMCVLKTVVVQIDDENALLVSLQYHSDAVNQSGYDRANSVRRWYAVCTQKKQLKAWARELWEAGDARAKMPLDKSKWFVCFGSQNAASCLADHLDVKLKKTMTWEAGMKKLDGWQTETPKRRACINPAAKWEDSGYLAPDGEEVCLRDRDALIKHLNEPLVKMVLSKAKLKTLDKKRHSAQKEENEQNV